MRPTKAKPGDYLNYDQNAAYKKYSGKYTNYAIYIDEHIADIAVPYEHPLIEKKVYDYLYAICYVLACKDHYFNNFNDYEKFAAEAAADFYIIFRNKYNNQGTTKRGKVIEPIKSSLNFIKKVLYAFKVEYIKKFFVDIYNEDWKGVNENRKEIEDQRQEVLGNYFEEAVRSEYYYKKREAVLETLSLLPELTKKVLYNTPFKKDKITLDKLYKSCLLSMINLITLPKDKKLGDNIEHSFKKYNKEYNCIILWHLPDYMNGYVSMLIPRIKEEVSKEIGEDTKLLDLSKDTVDDILSTVYTSYDSDQSEFN